MTTLPVVHPCSDAGAVPDANPPVESAMADQLREFVQTVQRNENTLRRFQQIELGLISAQSLSEYFHTLFVHLPVDFGLSWVGLWLDETWAKVDEVGQDAMRACAGQHLKLAQPHELLLDADTPWLGIPAADNLGGKVLASFGQIPAASMIVLPLNSQGSLLGFLCLASGDSQRFADGMATDLLERFAVIVAASMDNVAHRDCLTRISLTDPLTGLANRRCFDERLGKEIARSARYGAPLACVFFDLDHFKHINDTYGHTVGDRVLVAVAHCARQELRLADTLARYGGEEFAGLLPHVDQAGAIAVAERIRCAVSELKLRGDNGLPIKLTVSVGIALLKSDGAGNPLSNSALVAAADRAMYLAKRNGRNRVEVEIEPKSKLPRAWGGASSGSDAPWGQCEKSDQLIDRLPSFHALAANG